MTTSLFTTTLMVSFLVVAAPHLIPCPVDPRTLADSADPTGEKRRRRRRRIAEEDASDAITSEEKMRRLQIEEKMSHRRECPVPKPGGLIGQVLGMRKEDDNAEDTRPIRTRIERARKDAQSRNDQ